ncbi:chromate efflux transporter [Pararhodobacter marinus]|uniref:chromate efflux transporter n=1 Tax=Pararhodobacter marinus TaxID=2184063 RepID=UPI0035191B97
MTATPSDLRADLPVWARIGLLSFGGPAGQIALMHRECVETRGWIDEDRFLHALNFCMLLPGPEAMQLATYIGWLRGGWRGGVLAGGLFVLPGILAIMALSWVYVLAGDVDWIAGAFFGLKAAVIAIVAQALWRIGRKALKGPVALAIAGAAFTALFVFDLPFPLVVLAAAALGYARAPKHRGDLPPAEGRTGRTALVWAALWLVPVAALALTLGPQDVLTQVAVFFSQMAVLTFGGAYAVLAWVAQAAVDTQGWLAPGQMLDGLAMAETTPGPLIMVTQFVGFMAGWQAGGLGLATLAALITTWVTFAPCFLWIFALAPHAERLRHSPALAGALQAVTAAVVGVIANLALWFALHALWPAGAFDPWAAGLTALALIAAFLLKAGPGMLILGAALAGAGLRLVGLA